MEEAIKKDYIDAALNPDLDKLTRRTLIKRTGAAAGAAVLSAGSSAQGQSEAAKNALADESIIKKEISIDVKSADGKTASVKAFLAEPKNTNKRGSVLVVHEIFGLTEHIKSVACRLAQEGYTALAPDLFSREGEPPSLSGGFGPMMAFVGKISDSQIEGDLEFLGKYLKKFPHSNHKIGIVGFCWGGRVSMITDGAAKAVDAAVSYYGRVSGEKTANNPEHPIDLATTMHAPLMAHFGGKDQSIPPSEAIKLREALTAAGKVAEIYIYDSAGHAFNNDTRESFEPVSAKLAWSRTLSWFSKYLS